MTKTEIICDACGKPTNPAVGFINLNPLRGGIMLEVGTEFGSAGRNITANVNLCGPGCLIAYVSQVAATIKPATATPAPGAQSPQPTA